MREESQWLSIKIAKGSENTRIRIYKEARSQETKNYYYLLNTREFGSHVSTAKLVYTNNQIEEMRLGVCGSQCL